MTPKKFKTREGSRERYKTYLKKAQEFLRAAESALEIGDWDAAEQNCARIRAYTADEPLPLSDFIIARGLALARFGRGERSFDLQTALAGLRDVASSAELNAALPAIENALGAFGRLPVASQGG